MRRVQAELEVNQKMLNEKTTVRDIEEAKFKEETAEAEASYEKYDKLIADLEQSNAALIEKIEPVEKELKIEKEQRIDNIATEHRLKTEKDKNEEIKRVVGYARNVLWEKLDIIRRQLDEVLDNQSLITVQEENSKQAAESTKKILEVTLDKEKNMLKGAKKARLKMYKEWSAVEKKLNQKKTQISKYKFKTNLMVAKLKNEISTTTDNSIGPRAFIKAQRTKG